MKNADMPAMPTVMFTGLSKLEHFALEIYCANKVTNPHYENMGYQNVASYSDAIMEAKELLEEIEKSLNQNKNN